MKVFFGLVFLFLGFQVQAQLISGFTSLEDFESELPNGQSFVAWRNETLLIPFFIQADTTKSLTYELELNGKNVEAEFFQLHYVKGDISAGNCGNTKKNGTFETKLFPDRAESLSGNEFTVDEKKSFGLLNIEIPEKLKPGLYPFGVSFSQGIEKFTLKGTIQVINGKLPDFEALDYAMDIWQFPLSISTYYELEPYSEAHWQQIELMFRQLNEIHQSTVTTSVFYDLYNTSIKPLDQMMIQVRKLEDGSFRYDYSVFEKYVETAFKNGISDEIAVHNLYPWNLTYFYFDEASNKIKTFKSEPNTEEYKQFWTPFLLDFASFLRDKGWFEKTVFWVDERDISKTAELIKYVQSIVPSYKFGYSGRFSPGLSKLVFDYSLASNIVLEPDKLAERKASDFKTTFYTSCYEVQPNMLMASNYMDIYFLVLLSKARGYDGFLRWAFNLWSSTIMNSAIFSDLPSGDSHFVYPQGQVSLRYLILKDAIEEVQKVDSKKNLPKTNEMLQAYTRYFLLNIEKDRVSMVKAMKNYLND